MYHITQIKDLDANMQNIAAGLYDSQLPIKMALESQTFKYIVFYNLC